MTRTGGKLKLNDLAALLAPLPVLFSAEKFCVDFYGSHAATISDVESLLNRLLLKPPFSKSLLISFFYHLEVFGDFF